MIRNTKQEAKMNLQNTAYPVSSRPEELVPSRYALRVGEIDALVVSDGVLPLPGLTASQTTWSGQSEPGKGKSADGIGQRPTTSHDA